MLQGTKFDKTKLMGSVVVLLKETGEYEEFRVPKQISDTILTMDLTKYLKR